MSISTAQVTSSTPYVIGSLGRVLSAQFTVHHNDDNDNDDSSYEESFTLTGRSWAADGTAFCIPEWSVGLDAGLVVHAKTLRSLLVTHVHTDHAHFLTHLKSRTKPPVFVLPQESVPFAERVVIASHQMSAHMSTEQYEAFEWEPSYEFCGVAPGDMIPLQEGSGKKSTATTLFARILPCDHSVPCVGYQIVRIKSKLKPEYVGLPGKAIGQLRRQGVQVTDQVEYPLLTFMGDTHANIFKNDHDNDKNDHFPLIQRALSSPILVVECTFLSDDYCDNADRTKHVVWSHLKPIVKAHPRTLFVLIHFSHRYTAQDVHDFFAAPEHAMPNVLPWTEMSLSQDTYCSGCRSNVVPEIYSHS